MHISMWVAYDEKRLRRTLKFILRPVLKKLRIIGVLLIVLGLLIGAVGGEWISALGPVVLGVLFSVGIGPLTLRSSMRMQSNVIKDGFHMTLDDEWVTVSYPLVESRFRWAGLDSIVEMPDAWYAKFGKRQAFSIPKEPMTEEQRAQFSAFVNGLQPAWR